MMSGKAPYRLTLAPMVGKRRSFDVKTGIKTRAGARRHAREWATDVVAGVIHVEELQDVEGGGRKYVRVASGAVEGGRFARWL